MNSIIENFDKEQIKKLTSKKSIPSFRSGDTIKVTLKIIEGERSRLQAFEGMCISRNKNSVNSKFTIRKISHGEGVERVFPLFSPNIDKIEVIRKGDVKRAKLYYLRDRTGKSARIADKDRGDEGDEYTMSESPETEFNENNKQSENTESDKSLSQENLKNENEEVQQKESSKEPAEVTVVEETKSEKEKSESTASVAGETKDESNS